VADLAPTLPNRHWIASGDRRWLLAVLGLILMTACHPLLWDPGRKEVWFAPLALGLVLTAWLGLRLVPLLFCQLFLAELILRPGGTGVLPCVTDALLLSGEIALGWWCYHHQAGGSRRIDDPRSATLFLLLVPGVFAGLFAVLQATSRLGFALGEEFSNQVLDLWINRALALLALVPMLLMVATPWVVYYRWAVPDRTDQQFLTHPRLSWTLGELLETIGLAIGAGILGGALGNLHARGASTNWHLWGLLLLLIVWASLRVGLRGGSLVAWSATASALFTGTMLASDDAVLRPLSGNLLAQCSTALLVGASADWLRASEARYRQVVGHIPVILYSARLLGKPAPGVIPQVVIMFVSPACRHIFKCEPEALQGSHRNWLERILPVDRELVHAALAQLLLQKQPVTCEYRVAAEAAPTASGGTVEGNKTARSPLETLVRKAGLQHRWVRDTLAPRYDADGQLDGWDGVVEDITDQRLLAHDLRRTTNMLHALVAHLPTGVFFVHGVNGQPLLVNARARQLLGQREDLSAGLNRLSEVYRLFRPDGKPYPWDELPVCQALRNGATTMRDDIVVHRPDGRRVPLVTWAAPVNLGSQGEPDAAVWVLEDLTALRHAEAARQETELRLRAVVETMAEGLIVQNQAGAIVDCNPAACTILGASADQLRGWSSLGAEDGCLEDNGAPLARDGQPDRVVFRTGKPVRDMVLGIRVRAGGEQDGIEVVSIRWILANSMPASLTDKLGDNRGQRCVTTFADITAHRKALEVLRQSEEQYRGLVETLPLMLLQFAPDGSISYLNPATEEITGYGDELRQAGFWQSCIHADDRQYFATLLEATRAGQTARMEFRYRAVDGSEKVGYALAQPRQSGGTTMLVVDMTHRRRMEQELQKAQRMDLVAQIASGVVHDFNNLLTVILSYAELAKDAVGDDAVRGDLERITQAADQATLLAGQLLTFSKQRQVVMRQVDLNGITARALHLLRPALSIDTEVQLHLDPGEAWVLADESPLQQVVMNLCLNARDAMSNGGRLMVQTAAVSLLPGDATVARAAAATGGVRRWVRLSVQDNGCGMDEAVKARLFEPLFTTKQRGSGLGLAVVKQIVEGFGGCIHVTSTPGQGARFEIWLPASK
jgi:PAS domain S-box-containing protein